MIESIYKCIKPFTPTIEHVDGVIKFISLNLYHDFNDVVTFYKKCDVGQGLNYKIYTNNKKNPSYLLRIVSHKGYPNINKLNIVYDILKQNNIKYQEIIYVDKSDAITPYGHILWKWIPGNDGNSLKSDGSSYKWITQANNLISKIHKIKMPYWSSADFITQYRDFHDYCSCFQAEIENSFGDIFLEPTSIYDLEKNGIIEKGTIGTILKEINEIALSISEDFDPVLVHGDILPGNVIFDDKEIYLIDWDESRFTWWPYEIARTAFYMDPNLTYNSYKKYLNGRIDPKNLMAIIKIEHTRLYLRNIFILGLMPISSENIVKKADFILRKIRKILFPVHFSSER